MSWRTQGFADRDATARIPSWLNPLAQALPSVQSSDVTRFVPIDGSGRHACDSWDSDSLLCLFA